MLGSVILWGLIGAVSGRLNFALLYTSAKLSTFALLLGLAQTVVVTSGDGAIDLSQTYILTLSAYISCTLTNTAPLTGFLAATIVGAVCGLANGLINVYLKVPAMIATLATGYIIFSIILVGAPHMKALPDPALVAFINKNPADISMLTLIAIALALLLSVALYKTPYGKRLHAVGQNKTAAHYAGIAVNRVVVTAFVIAGSISGIAGALCGAFIGGAFQDMGSTYFLPSIAATFVGGTSAAGGRSSVMGVCFGALMMSFMSTFLNVAKILPGTQRLLQGAFLVLILVASVSGSKKR
jgi:ribose transport system permease protein